MIGWIHFECGIYFEHYWGLGDFDGHRKSASKFPKWALQLCCWFELIVWALSGMWHKHKTVEYNFDIVWGLMVGSQQKFIMVLQQSLIFLPPRRLRRVIKKRCKLWWAQVWDGRQIGGVKEFCCGPNLIVLFSSAWCKYNLSIWLESSSGY